MRHSVPFVRILEDAVAAATASNASKPAASSALPRALGFFEFTIRAAHPSWMVPGNRSTYQIVAEPRVNSQRPRTNPPTCGSCKVEVGRFKAKKRLTRTQQQAVDEMTALGACLAVDFSDDDLRGAYRLLARRYHPDCHPACSEAEKARLGALFARVHASYQLLLQRDARQ